MMTTNSNLKNIFSLQVLSLYDQSSPFSVREKGHIINNQCIELTEIHRVSHLQCLAKGQTKPWDRATQAPLKNRFIGLYACKLKYNLKILFIFYCCCKAFT